MSIPDPENSPVKEKPWKYLGYPQYSRQIALSDDYQIFRKFAILHTRVALALQDEIVVLETRLDEIDVETSTVEADDIHNGSFRFETRKDRAQLIREIKGKLVEYGKRQRKDQPVSSHKIQIHFSPIPVRCSCRNGHPNTPSSLSRIGYTIIMDQSRRPKSIISTEWATSSLWYRIQTHCFEDCWNTHRSFVDQDCGVPRHRMKF